MRTSIIVVLVTAVFCGLFATGCDDIVSDPNFHTWCGDQLCSWKLDSGKIQRAPTWNEKDYGVELLDSTDANHTTAISQVSDTAAHCLEFSTVADVDAQAQVFIDLDFNNDGTIDSHQQIAATGFTEQRTQITGPVGYDGIRFIISKTGTGRAVLAQMEVRSVNTCAAAPVTLHAQPLGSQCSDPSGDECSSGFCCLGRCAECCGDTCGGERKCEQILPGNGTSMTAIPRQCDPGMGTHNAGAECLLAQDCTSKVCEGAVWNVFDASHDFAPCPPPPFASTCFVASVHAGRCR